jgi:hypothetical protein
MNSFEAQHTKGDRLPHVDSRGNWRLGPGRFCQHARSALRNGLPVANVARFNTLAHSHRRTRVRQRVNSCDSQPQTHTWKTQTVKRTAFG